MTPTPAAPPRSRAVTHLARATLRSASRLDQLRQMPNAPAPTLAHERAILERRALRLLDAARHLDDLRFRWDLEAEV